MSVCLCGTVTSRVVWLCAGVPCVFINVSCPNKINKTNKPQKEQQLCEPQCSTSEVKCHSSITWQWRPGAWAQRWCLDLALLWSLSVSVRDVAKRLEAPISLAQPHLTNQITSTGPIKTRATAVPGYPFYYNGFIHISSSQNQHIFS